MKIEHPPLLQTKSKSKSKSKRLRTIFTSEQLERLEAEFDRQQYMVGNERLRLARKLDLTDTQVKVIIFEVLIHLNRCTTFPLHVDLVSKSSN